MLEFTYSSAISSSPISMLNTTNINQGCLCERSIGDLEAIQETNIKSDVSYAGIIDYPSFLVMFARKRKPSQYLLTTQLSESYQPGSLILV